LSASGTDIGDSKRAIVRAAQPHVETIDVVVVGAGVTLSGTFRSALSDERPISRHGLHCVGEV
jgi:hypothetical protein